jgi:hypothetical protein
VCHKLHTFSRGLEIDVLAASCGRMSDQVDLKILRVLPSPVRERVVAEQPGEGCIAAARGSLVPPNNTHQALIRLLCRHLLPHGRRMAARGWCFAQEIRDICLKVSATRSPIGARRKNSSLETCQPVFALRATPGTASPKTMVLPVAVPRVAPSGR